MSAVRYEVRDGLAEIYLAHAPANALDVEVLDVLIAALETADRDDSVYAILLASDLAGRFCAGLDLKKLLASSAADAHALLSRLYIKLYDTQFNLSKPSIAVVSGAVRGGGMTVAISCDMMVAADSATFGYPEIDVGVLPAIHFAHLPRIVGKHRAFDLLFTGRIFDAPAAADMGLVARLCPDDALMDSARRLGKELAAKPREVLRLGRRAFVHAADGDYRRNIAAAVEVFCNALALPQSREGLSAFVEKRKPDWNGAHPASPLKA